MAGRMEEGKLLLAMFERAVELAHPARALAGRLPEPPRGRTFVAAFGKAAASMARVVEDAWPTGAPMSGLAVTRYGHGTPLERIELIEAAHPVPDRRSREAAGRVLAEAGRLGPDDLLLALVSGGGSSLMVEPLDGITLEEKQAVNGALLRSGAPIGAMNAVRRHMSAIKGGRLAQAASPALVRSYAISDVPGDDPATIASGPTVGDPTTLADAFDVLDRYAIDVAPHVREAMRETPKSVAGEFTMIATPDDVVAEVAKEFEARSLGAGIEGEARDIGRDHAALALAGMRGERIVSGGETTVTIDGPGGRGGRNVEYLLSLAIHLDGAPVHAIACDTDGIDGSEDNAGAMIGPDTLARARSLGLDAQACLDGHDAYTFFERLGDLVVTGPTRTNVNDFRAILT